MLTAKNLCFGYDAQNTFHFPNFSASATEPLLVVGESGVGKTTLLHLIGGLLAPKTGKILIDDTDINQLKKDKLDVFRGKNIGIVSQKSLFIAALSVKENILAAPFFAHKKTPPNALFHLCESLNITQKLLQKPYTLSAGEQQRVAIARVLINSPKLLLADEPTSGLDDKNCHAVAQLLQNQCQALGTTLVVVTHDARLKSYFNHSLQL